jgi:penicillin-binding protein 2
MLSQKSSAIAHPTSGIQHPASSRMLIFDQLKKNDAQLRLLALVVFCGMALLLGGLWWVQIVSFRRFQENLETQSFRTVRIPAVRGKILDRNGTVLAENRPVYNVSLYLEELSPKFRAEYSRSRPTKVVNDAPFYKRWLGLDSVRTQYVRLKKSEADALTWEVRHRVASNVAMQIAARLQEPVNFDKASFQRHYEQSRALPYPLLVNLTPTQIARFEEQAIAPAGVDLEVQSVRAYPFGTTAAHLLGCLQKGDRSVEGEEAFFDYRLPDYYGLVGTEAAHDKDLRGRAGAKSVLVNNLGYRQSENVWTAVEAGKNVVLTIDLQIQRAAEQALPVLGPQTRGAAVVMDVESGDVLALASCPTFNPNYFVDRKSFPPDYYQRVQALSAEKNRATQENYAPGSIFKTVVGLACLESGLDPNAIYNVAPHPHLTGKGVIHVGRRPIIDLAAPGPYDFRRALKRSSNAYFITNGIYLAHIENIVKLGQRLHLGEKIGLSTRQETAGIFPTLQRVRSHWADGDTANICIGQGEVNVTPLQMAVLTAAIANGGTVLRPRFVDRIEPQDPTFTEQIVHVPKHQVRDTLGVQPRNLKILQEAMLADVIDADGTGRRAAVPGMQICGKTGTAQVTDERNKLVDHITWFVSFAPYQQPRYAVVVMIESGGSGGETCAPIAGKIYEAILKRDTGPKPGAIAQVK